MRTSFLLLAAGLLPLVAVTAAYSLAANRGLVPGCNPFFDGCTSISATGRHAPASYVFKPAHLVQAVLLAVLWLQCAAVLPAGARTAVALRISGLVGAAALVVYTLTLGSQTPLYEFMRRFGIYFYFVGTLCAQVLATSASFPVIRRSRPSHTAIAVGLWMLCLAPFALGAANFVFKAVLDDAGPMQNRIEWTAALAMQGWFLLSYASQFSGLSAPPARTSANGW
jgi:hypothetical protein